MWLLSIALASPVEDAVEVVDAHRSLRIAAHAPVADPRVWLRAVDGPEVGVDFVDGVAAGKGWGITVFPTPVEAVWMAVNDADTFPADLSGLAISRTVAGTPRATGRHVFQLAPLPIVADRWWVVEQSHNEGLYTATGGRVWELASRSLDAAPPPGDLADTTRDGVRVAWTESAWLLTRIDAGSTLVEYYVWTDPGGRIPAGPASRFAAGAIRKLLDQMRARAARMSTAPRAGFVRPDQTPLD